jgi:hypothetical protein
MSNSVSSAEETLQITINVEVLFQGCMGTWRHISCIITPDLRASKTGIS